jgi:hypothetical protein
MFVVTTHVLRKSYSSCSTSDIVVLLLNDTNFIWHENRVGHQYTLINTNNIYKTWLGYSCLLLFSDWWQRSLPCLLLLSDWWQWSLPYVCCYFLTGGSEAFLMFVVTFWLVAVRLPSCLLLLSDWWQWGWGKPHCHQSESNNKHEGSLTATSQKVTINTREASLPPVRK